MSFKERLLAYVEKSKIKEESSLGKWFDSLTKKQQDEYRKLHPNKRVGKHNLNKEEHDYHEILKAGGPFPKKRKKLKKGVKLKTDKDYNFKIVHNENIFPKKKK